MKEESKLSQHYNIICSWVQRKEHRSWFAVCVMTCSYCEHTADKEKILLFEGCQLLCYKLLSTMPSIIETMAFTFSTVQQAHQLTSIFGIIFFLNLPSLCATCAAQPLSLYWPSVHNFCEICCLGLGSANTYCRNVRGHSTRAIFPTVKLFIRW